jgi:hypothetical protein
MQRCIRFLKRSLKSLFLCLNKSWPRCRMSRKRNRDYPRITDTGTMAARHSTKKNLTARILILSRFPKCPPPQLLPFDLKNRDRPSQVIVKLANIELTPENPKYEGGAWHARAWEMRKLSRAGIYYYHLRTSLRLDWTSGSMFESQRMIRAISEVLGITTASGIKNPWSNPSMEPIRNRTDALFSPTVPTSSPTV